MHLYPLGYVRLFYEKAIKAIKSYKSYKKIYHTYILFV